MPLSRNPRMDRRRRTIRENLSVVSDGSDEGRVSPSRTTRQAEITELTKKERGVAYSHSVRRACQHRLVQFIPVRKLSLTGAVAASSALPIVLMALHYLVFVSGTLDWSGHPMSALLNANSPRSLAAWLSSHLWLLCLGSTVLTFRLRKHKLDDYDGEYRLWFWLVFTCIIGSIDSTTRLTELFGAALDRWSQLHVGWSGGAIVQATLATLIGMLGLRLCTELKTVPTSLVLWLVGIVCWAASAALSQSLFQLDMSPPVRSWLRASLWLGGLTSIWLCSLYFLRATFMEAQKRFLSRALTSANAVPWQQRVREAMPSLPTIPRFGLGKKQSSQDEVDQEQPVTTRKKKVRPSQTEFTEQESEQAAPRRTEASRPSTSPAPVTTPQSRANNPARNSAENDETSADETAAPSKRRWSFGLGKLTLRPPAAKADHPSNVADSTSVETDEDAQVKREYGKKPGWFSKHKSAETDQADHTADAESTERAPRRSLKERFAWSRKRDTENAAEEPRREDKPRRQSEDTGEDQEGTPQRKRSWMKLPKPRLPKMSLPKPRLPKLKLPSFRLPTPGEADSPASDSSNSNSVPVVNQSRPLPSTSSARPDNSANEDQDNDNARGLSKAERKRLKRLQQENERRAA